MSSGGRQQQGSELSGVSLLIREGFAQTLACSDSKAEGRGSKGPRPGKVPLSSRVTLELLISLHPEVGFYLFWSRPSYLHPFVHEPVSLRIPPRWNFLPPSISFCFELLTCVALSVISVASRARTRAGRGVPQGHKLGKCPSGASPLPSGPVPISGQCGKVRVGV